jgi:hypothetical protein
LHYAGWGFHGNRFGTKSLSDGSGTLDVPVTCSDIQIVSIEIKLKAFLVVGVEVVEH